MSELCQPTDAELRALCASATGPSHLESLIPLANYRDIVALRRKLHEFPELANREHGTAATLREELAAIDARRAQLDRGAATRKNGVIGGPPRRRATSDQARKNRYYT